MKNISFYKVTYINEEGEKSSVFINSNDFQTFNKSVNVSPERMKKRFSDSFKILISISPVYQGRYDKIVDASRRANTILGLRFWDSISTEDNLGLDENQTEEEIDRMVNLYDSAI